MIMPRFSLVIRLGDDVGLGIVLERDVHDRADGRDLHAVRERAPGDRDPHGADLDDRDAPLLDLDEAVGVALGPFEDLLRKGAELVLARGRVADLHEFHVADGPLLCGGTDPFLEVHRDGVLVKELVDPERDKIGYLRF